MHRTKFLLAAVAALSLALTPGLADARAGGKSSFGSRGSMTNSAPPTTRTAPETAQPMQRTMTPSTPAAGAVGGAAMPSRSSSFMSGLAGGLIGVGLGGLLFGHGFFGSGLGGIGFLGLLLQIGLVALLVWFLVRLFRNRQQPAMAGGPNMFARNTQPDVPPMARAGGGGGATPPAIQVGPGDYQQFERLLVAVQAAWSNHDLNALRSMTTPEMLGYFNEQLSDQASRGQRNEVTDVRLESGDLAQAWAEGGREYATVAMRFSMIDVTRDQAGRVIDGSPTERDVATELWTFVRGRGGQWILSAIQQAGR
ncbi:MAG: Tim44 domain-containing protein [Acetobacteraceae bacterium]